MKRIGQVYRETLVNSVKEGVDSNSNVFLVSYTGIDGIKLNEFRRELKNANASVFATKNSLARLALSDMNCAELGKQLEGQTAFVWSNADSSEVSKILVKFAKEIETLNVQGGILEGRTLSQDDVKTLADLPSREILLSTLLSVIQAPMTRLAGALNAKSRDLLSILKQLSEKKGGS